MTGLNRPAVALFWQVSEISHRHTTRTPPHVPYSHGCRARLATPRHAKYRPHPATSPSVPRATYHGHAPPRGTARSRHRRQPPSFQLLGRPALCRYNAPRQADSTTVLVPYRTLPYVIVPSYMSDEHFSTNTIHIIITVCF